MKKITLSLSFLILGLISMASYAQTNRVLVKVDWQNNSYRNKVEVYDPANNLLVSICNDAECYQASGSENEYVATYDLGCLAIDPPILPNYYIKLYEVNDSDWGSDNTVTVNVGGNDVVVDNGSNASAAGHQINFNINSPNLCTLPDTDGDGVVDLIDQDDDNDGILDVAEGLGLNNFNCTVPSLNFNSKMLETGPGDTVGSIWRFGNALEGYDVLIEITEIDNTVLIDMDDDGQDTVDFLQTRLEFTGTGTPGITFKFTIVDTGTLNPASTIFRIGGTTWDCDGTNTLQESVRYYNPSAYGLDNPTSLTTDTYIDGTGITAGTVTYGGFATNTILRSYFQFLSNTFTIRMQAKKSSGSTVERLYAMSFTQCDIFDYKAPTLIILNGEDTDNDGIDNEFDLDSDNDGIPDNVELQTTAAYIAPNITIDLITGLPATDINGDVIGVDPVTGIDTAYTAGLTLTDTDGDNIPDIIDLDSDNDGNPDNQENGMPYIIDADCSDSICDTDTDGDGLYDPFEGAFPLAPDPYDVNDDIDNPSSSILPDTDGDLFTGGDLDYRDASDFGAATIDFDGVDDYMDADSFLGSANAITMMGWVKLDATFNTTAVLFGQDNFILEVNGASRLLTTNVNGNTATSSVALPLNEWVHIASFYSITTIDNGIDARRVRTFINGTETSSNVGGGLNFGLNPSTAFYTIGKNATSDIQYFKGSIDEVRVFGVALSETQIQGMMHQELQLSGLDVGGTILPKPLVDILSNATIAWLDLEAYWPMTNIASSKTDDLSLNGRDATLYNITTIQPQTAPMPYETTMDGDWSEASTWLHGDVWDIDNTATAKNYAIVQIHDNVSTSDSHAQLGLFIDDNKTLTVNGDNAITNSWYFELNGVLDLQNDSQLIQTVNSDLVTATQGRVLRRQEGNTNVFWYNYWTSPIGARNATTLSPTGDNGPDNNSNNTPFSINLLNQANLVDVQFTTALSPPLTNPVTLSSRWFYNFQNGLDYNDWVEMDETTAMIPGIGYTQKGTGAAGLEQQYVFEGKPNNGTILVPADDVDGDSANESEEGVTMTLSLVGNPYPSALDAVAFINDNAGTIQGTILLWEQWDGSSHYLSTYQGGYGYINTMTTARAYQHPDIVIADQTQTQGIKTPTFFIPVGQGFFVEVVADDDDIEFNNSQRVFKKEALNETIFFDPISADSDKPITSEEATRNNNPSNIDLIRFEFSTSAGASRHFVTGFSDTTSDGFDYGFDGGLITTTPEEDMGIYVDDQHYVLQAFAPITPEKVVDLTFNGSGDFTYSLEMIDIQNIDATQDVYLKDNQENIYWNLRQGAYNFTAFSGQDHERFDLVFQPGETLSDEEFNTNDVLIYVNNNEDKLFIKGLHDDAKSLSFTNMIGQNIKTLSNVSVNTLENGIDVSQLASGVYVINVITDNTSHISKKVIIE